ncbi:MAG: 50S ribosomal protein L25 [Pseudomonadota bacterium]
MSNMFPMVAEKREDTGKGPNRRLRNSGMIPAVLYGKGLEPVALSVQPKQIMAAIAGPLKMNTLLELDIQDGGKSLGKKAALLSDYQIHPLRRSMLHADFTVIDLSKPIKVRIPIEVTGRAKGIVEGGLIQIIRRDIGISCQADRIPTSILVDVTELEIGDNIHVGEVKLPEGATPTDSPTYTILTCAAPEIEKVAEVAAVEGEVAAAPAEGEAAAAGDKKVDDKKADDKKGGDKKGDKK